MPSKSVYKLVFTLAAASTWLLCRHANCQTQLNVIAETAHFKIVADFAPAADVGLELERIATYLKLQTELEINPPGTEKPQVRILSPDRYRSIMRERLLHDKAELLRQLAVFEALGLANSAASEPIVAELMASDSMGFYDQADQSLTLKYQDGLDVQTAAHELVHLIQDRHIGLDYFEECSQLSEDGKLAAKGVVEGMAELTAVLLPHYTRDRMSEPSLSSLKMIRAQAMRQIDQHYRFRQIGQVHTPENVRQVVYADGIFPYTYGLLYCVERAINAKEKGTAFASWYRSMLEPSNLPQSTEQILDGHDAWNEQPLVIEIPTDLRSLVNDQSHDLIESDVLGDLLCRLFLGRPIPDRKNPSGWAGDRLLLIKPRTGQPDLKGVLIIGFDTISQAKTIEDLFNETKDNSYAARSSCTHLSRHEKTLVFELNNPPTWFVEPVQSSVRNRPAVPESLSLRQWEQSLVKWFESGTDSDPLPLKKIEHLPVDDVAARLAKYVFEYGREVTTRQTGLSALQRAGIELSNSAVDMNEEWQDALRRLALDAACHPETSPLGLLNSIHVLAALDVPLPERQRLIESAAHWDPRFANLADAVEQRWGKSK